MMCLQQRVALLRLPSILRVVCCRNLTIMSMFGAKDLALLLSDEVGDAYSLRHTVSESTQKYEAPKPRIDPTRKVARYWAGQGVEAAESDEEGEEFEALAMKKHSQAAEAAAASIVVPADDSRLRRLQAKQPSSSSSGRRRRVIEAEVVVSLEDEENGDQGYVEGDIVPGDEFEEAEDEIADRRNRVKERLRSSKEDQEHRDGEATARVVQDSRIVTRDVQQESSSESEYETESDEEDEQQLLKPVFVPKLKRETIMEQERKAAEEAARLEQEAEELEERKQQTRAIVAETIRRQEELKEMDRTDADSDAGMPDDTDGLDEVLEYEAWKVREMRRIKRALEEREAMEREKADIERRRNMTDEERMREDEEAGRFKEKEKKQWKFMQKYYHKGVFYMDEDSVKTATDARAKSYDGATGEDRVNKEALPEVLQVRNFGKRGRTKWKHLVAEDTTSWDNPWFQRSELRQKYTSKMAGMKDISSSKRARKD